MFHVVYIFTSYHCLNVFICWTFVDVYRWKLIENQDINRNTDERKYLYEHLEFHRSKDTARFGSVRWRCAGKNMKTEKERDWIAVRPVQKPLTRDYKSRTQNRHPNWLMRSALIKFSLYIFIFFSILCWDTFLKSLLSDYVEMCVHTKTQLNPQNVANIATSAVARIKSFSIGSRIFTLDSNCSHFKSTWNFMTGNVDIYSNQTRHITNTWTGQTETKKKNNNNKPHGELF